MTITNPRSIDGHVCRLNWQSAQGAAASTTGTLVVVADALSISRGSIRAHPGGTTGFRWPIDTEFEAAIQPTAKLTLHVGALQLAPFLESITAGAPTVADANITESGDTGNLLGTWALTGVRPGINTDSSWKLYVKIDADYGDATTTRIELYKDSARASLVAAGSIVDGLVPGTVTLAAQNSSGLSGTVALASVPTVDNTAISLTAGLMTFVWADQWSRYFTLWRDTGSELEQLIDCVVHRLSISGQDGGGVLKADVEIAAGNHEWTTTAFTAAAPPSLEFLPYLGSFKADQDGSEETISPIAVSFEISRSLKTVWGGAATPGKLISENVSIFGGYTFPHCDESDAIIDRAYADSWDALEAKFQSGTQYIDFVFDKVKFTEAKLPDTSSSLGDLELPWVAVQDTASVSTAPLVITAVP